MVVDIGEENQTPHLLALAAADVVVAEAAHFLIERETGLYLDEILLLRLGEILGGTGIAAGEEDDDREVAQEVHQEDEDMIRETTSVQQRFNLTL